MKSNRFIAFHKIDCPDTFSLAKSWSLFGMAITVAM